MPHSWDHTNLTKIPLDHAKNDIIKCLDYFEANLNDFKASDAVYNFAYNASTPELIDFALSHVKAVRTGGSILDYGKRANPYPDSNGPFKLGCWSHGPDNSDEWVEKEVNEFLSSSGGWLILNLHGLDDEGWGPISTNYLNELLNKLIKIDYLDVLPTGVALKQMKG
jgi:peptidoglycan/xylan/chitin deacetylase (PgdA/CDA1 family)